MPLAETSILVGPVLSFRGIKAAAGRATWQVTALIVTPDDAPAPTFVVDGKERPAPVVLWKTAGRSVLRYDCSVTQTKDDRRVTYGVKGQPGWTFTVPGKTADPRLAYVSCNGFSNPDVAKKMTTSIGAVWQDLLSNHDPFFREPNTPYKLDKEQRWHEENILNKDIQRFHLLLMGGDQVYLDSIWHTHEDLMHWVGLSREEQIIYSLSDAKVKEIEDYYVGLYVERWLPKDLKQWGERQRSAHCASALSSIPTVMMWDDHDIFDGWGSYSPEMQASPMFQALYRAARRAFWVFQLQQCIDDLPELEHLTPAASTFDPHLKPVEWAQTRKRDPLTLPFLNTPGFSYAHALGRLELLVMDLRTERSYTQILGADTWDALTSWMLDAGRPECHHLLVMSSVPAVHPKLTLAENVLDVSGTDDVLNSNSDDLRDHWSHDDHDGERKRLFRRLVEAAQRRKLRTTLVSGDVHVAAWGSVARNDATPATNWLRVHQLTSSAVVHPSPSSFFERAFLAYLNLAAGQKQDIDSEYSVEMMLVPGHRSKILAARNWLAMEIDAERRLWATWRAEAADRFSNHLLAIHPVHMKGS